MALLLIDSGPIATVTLNRPEVHNAFDEQLIAELTLAFADLGKDSSVRVIVLAATGESFSAGGDLNWMRRMAGYDRDENIADAETVAAMFRTIDECPKPTIAKVQGSAFAGGTGLISACDIAFAVDSAEFALTEVRIGLVPAVVAPYIIRAIGVRQMRRWTLTAQRMSAAEAHRIGLVHGIVPAADLDAVVDAEARALMLGGAQALASAKDLIRSVARPLDAGVIAETAERIADQRASDEGKEGVSAFLEKRPPTWRS
jgi:methylglutaconyl-CoA hydratase